MRILILSQYFWPESFLVNDLVRQLRSNGHDVNVLTGMPNYPGGKFFSGYGLFRKWKDDFEGTPIFRVPLWPRGTGGAINLMLNYLSFVITTIAVGLPRLQGKFDATVVFAPSPIIQVFPAIVYKWMTGTPVALWVQDLWPESLRAVGAVRSPRILGYVGQLVRLLYNHCDSILIQSQAFRTGVSSLCEKSEKIVYIPNWAEDLYQPIQVLSSIDKTTLLPSGFKVMFAGNLGKAQSLETILEAATLLKKYDDIHWIILGEGREKPEFVRKVARLDLGDRVQLLGRFPPCDMPKFFALADALLVTLRPDPVFDLTIPSKVQAYMACGRPIIAAINGEGRRVIDEAGAGLTGPAADAQQLANNVLRLYNCSDTDRKQLANQALRYSELNFNRRQIVDRLEQTLMSLKQKEHPE